MINSQHKIKGQITDDKRGLFPDLHVYEKKSFSHTPNHSSFKLPLILAFSEAFHKRNSII